MKAVPSTAILAAVLFAGVAAAQDGPSSPSSDRQVEDQIAAGINAYRAELGLPRIERSAALDLVARTHVADLAAHHPDTGTDARGLACNTHSWSTAGSWRPVCYTADHAYAERMWSKPAEITRGAYPGQGFEIAMASSGAISAPVALAGWKASAAHDAVITEQGTWAGQHWRAFGVGVGPGYAVVWFGHEPDRGDLGRVR
jgi:uncharacterized protein YkwD